MRASIEELRSDDHGSALINSNIYVQEFCQHKSCELCLKQYGLIDEDPAAEKNNDNFSRVTEKHNESVDRRIKERS
jgi:hypothetical protein